MKKTILALLACLLVLSSAAKTKKSATVRNSDKVRQEQRATRQRINNTKTEINDNQAKTRDGLRRLGEIEADIAVRQEAIRRTEIHIAELNSRITALSDSVEGIEADIVRLKDDYAESLRAIRRQRQTLNSVSYLFSSGSFTQAFRRVRYMQELGLWRKAKTQRMAEAAEELKRRKEQLDSVRQRVADEQAAQIVAKTNLDKRKEDAREVVNELKQRGRTLNDELRRQQQQLNELNRELDRVIAEEVRRAEEERRRKAEEEKRRKAEEEKRRKAEEEKRRKAEEERKRAEAAAREGESAEKPAEQKPQPATEQKPQQTKPAAEPQGESGYAEQERKLTGDFEANKGKLLFPVAGKYTITGSYGKHTRPGTYVEVDNHGIDISVDRGTAVRAVFGGEVVKVFKVKGTGFYAVLIRHGRYITVYTKLASYSVKNGQHVKAGQTIGTVFTDPEADTTVLHFEIRHESTTVNPIEWVK